MVTFPNAKINLGLHVFNKLETGFHNLETVFYPVDLCDILEIIPSEDSKFSFHSSGLAIPGDEKQNLCIRAYDLLKADFDIPPINLHLHKVIPMGAGLGGGSSDGVFTLMMLNDLFHLGLSDKQLYDYAGQLGSDCSFFLINRPCFAYGRGDQFKPFNPNLSLYQILIVVPSVHVNTAGAFTLIDEQRPLQQTVKNFIDVHTSCNLMKSMEKDPETWSGLVKNDFEIPVFAAHPVLAEIKQQLYDSGAVYAAMSGSGSALFGIFRQGEISLKPFEKHYTWIGKELATNR